MRRLLLLTKLTLWLLPLQVGAQTLSGSLSHGNYIISYNYWTANDKLPSWVVQSMKQDRRGYIWMCSPKAFFSFDGRQFKTYQFPDYDVKEFVEMTDVDAEDRIWLQVKNSYGQDRILIFHTISGVVNDLSVLGAPAHVVASASSFVATDDFYFVTTRESEVWKYDGEWALYTKLSCSTCKFFPATENKHWEIGVGHSSIKLYDQTGAFKDFSSLGLNPDYVFSIDGKMQLWARKYLALNEDKEVLPVLVGEDQSLDFDAYYDSRFDAPKIPASSYLGFSKLQSGGYRFAISKHARVELRHHNKDIGFKLTDFFNGSMNFNLGLVNQLYFPEDGGVVWLRFVGGLMRLQVKEVQLRTYPQLNGESIRGIYVDDQYAVVTTYTGVYKSAGALGESEMYKMELRPDIRYFPGAGVYKFNDTLWVAMDYNYAFYLTENSLRLARPPVDKLIKCHNHSESSHVFMRDSRGRLLLNTKSGILKYSRKEESFLPYLLPNERVYYSIEHNDSIYATTDRGIINLKSNKLFKIKIADGSTLRVLHIHADKMGYFWLSTDKGLYRWLPGTKQIKAFTRSYGLPIEKTYGCLVDNSGRFWLPTDVGLFVLDFEKKVSFSFNKADGMPHDECNNFSFFKAKNGRMYFGTIRGLFSIHPDSIATPLDAKNQVWVDDISTLRSNGTFLSVLNEYLQDGVLKLRKRDRQVQISFSSPSYSRLITAYKWRIPTISESWETTSDNRISFYGLPYGKHQLEIVPLGTKAYSFDSELVTRIPLYVIRPFYSTWYFILMLFFVLVGVAILVIKWRLQSVERKNIQLNALVTEKTKALIQQNEVVSQQKEEIEHLYELKNRQLAHLNHELRTPLTIIKGYIREIKNAIKGQAEVSKALVIMERNADQLFELTEDVLELARFDAGTVTLNEEPCEWQKFLQQISANFEGLASRKGITYTIEWDDIPEGLMVLVDRKKTERILNNLLMNALKFTLKGGSITIISLCKAGTLQVKVRDTGSGIQQSDLSRIFNRYYQVLNTVDSTRPGFGIGLALCREYADLMGGSLHVESEWGVGSEFCLTLPLKPAPEQKDYADNIDPSLMDSFMVFYTDSNDDHTLRPRLLIAEDSPDMRQYLYDVLSAHFEVSLANDGAIAWRMLKESKNPFDLVISDIMMPNMDGTMLLKKIRTSEKLSDMPFIFLTALAEQEQIIEALYLGVDSYLTKPFTVEELLARINNLLLYRKQRHQHLKNIQEEDKTDHTNLADDVKWLKELDAILEKKIHFSDLKIDDLAHDLFVSERTFRTKIRTYSGLSPSDYLMKYRLRKALLLLENQSYSNISQVCYAVGFKNASHFSKVFKSEYGKSPSDYLR